MADLENGLFPGGARDHTNPASPSMTAPFVSALLKGGSNGFALKGGDATKGALATFYEGPRPPGYQPMRKQ